MTKDNKANRLIHEKSPYLLQHAHNPVDWYAWGEEAFAKAKAENKPIFLSVGYSTCHWCHVMAHQSFEDNEVAKLLNERFISIKVDREERPDVDSIYMRVCQMLTGQGGWPLSVFLTPDQKPFFAGTYFPKKSMYGKPGFIDVITQLYDKYIEDPQRISEVADKLVEGLNEKAQSTTQGSELNVNVLQKTYKQLSKSFDGIYGGFGAAPKFPIPHMLTFLNRYYHWSKEENALFFVEKTLNGMANGGIFDHVGFGFARYSTDAMWLAPHFEKMLYDNALLITAYTEAYQLTKNERYKKVCETTIEFLEREMISPEGGFYSALDADTEGVEGKYYVWDKGEILHTLGTEFGDLYCEVYDISEDGNFEEKNIPNLIHTNIDKIRSKYGLTMSELEGKLEIARKKLLEERSLRTYPHVDDKILTSWNAMMIAALAKAGKVFENQQYFDLASNAMQFIEASLTENGRIMVRYRDGEVKNKGYIDDYAFLLWAYLELYETSLELSCLQSAKKIAEDMMDLFWDSEYGGFFFTGSDGEALIVREKELYDGALPSGNSVAAVQLVRLSNLTGNEEYTERVQSMVRKFATEVEAYGSGHTFFLQAFLMLQLPRKEIVVIGPKDDQNRQKLVSALQQSFTTTNTLLVAERPEEFAGIAEYATHYRMLDNKTTVYVCENFTCNQPTTNIDEVLKSLNL